jgi:simple sugar transport system ATP-binding protein
MGSSMEAVELTEQRTPVLSIREVSRSFGRVRALTDVSLDLYPGEIVALVGDNGAGKSTLLKILAGADQPTYGHLMLEGEQVSFASPLEAMDRGISVVYQDLALVPDLDVSANFFLGREIISKRWPGRWFGWLDKKAMRAAAEEQILQTHVRIPSSAAACRELSGGQRQGVAIARAVSTCDRVILLDEPTAALGAEQQLTLLKTIETVRDRGVAVVLVSHDLAQVLKCADRILVLRQGRLATTLTGADTTVEALLGYITGLLVD